MKFSSSLVHPHLQPIKSFQIIYDDKLDRHKYMDSPLLYTYKRFNQHKSLLIASLNREYRREKLSKWFRSAFMKLESSFIIRTQRLRGQGVFH